MIDPNYIHKYRIVQFLKSQDYGFQETQQLTAGGEYWVTVITHKDLQYLRLIKATREREEDAKFIIIE